MLGTVQAEGWALLDQYKGHALDPDRGDLPGRRVRSDERSSRCRSLRFISLGVAIAIRSGAGSLAIPENGYTGIYLPLRPNRGSALFHPVHPLGGPSTASVDPRSHAAVPAAPALAAVLAVSAALTSCIRIPASRASGPPRM